MLSARSPSARLRRAVQGGNLPLVRRLLHPPTAAPVDVRNPDPRSLTSLSWAALCGWEDLFEYLVCDEAHDDDELSRDGDNNTILHLLASLPLQGYTPPQRSAAFASGDLAVRLASIYYDRFSFVLDWSNTEGKTALHVAAQEGKEPFVNLLIDLGADVDLPDMYGNTPLHYASAWNHLPVCRILLDRGGRFGERNNDGFTAGDFAYSVALQNTLMSLARAQFDSKRLAKRTHTGLTSSTASYSYTTSPATSAVDGGEEEEVEGLRLPPPAAAGEDSPVQLAHGAAEEPQGGESASPPPPPPPPKPPKPPKPTLNTNLSSASYATAATSLHPFPADGAGFEPSHRSQSTTPVLPPPASPAPSTPSTSSRFTFHLPHRDKHKGGGSATPPAATGGQGGPPVSPLRLRSSSLSAPPPQQQPTSSSSSSFSLFPHGHSHGHGRPLPPSAPPSTGTGSDTSSRRRKKTNDGGGGGGGGGREKWGLGRSGKPMGLIAPSNMKARWGK